MSRRCRRSSRPRRGSPKFTRHSGARRRREPQMCDCTSGSLDRQGVSPNNFEILDRRAGAPRNDGNPPCSESEFRATDTVSHTLVWRHLMHILLLGSGGREHALAWKIAASPLVTKLWCAPGNAGIAREAECVALDIADHAVVIDFCRTNAVDFVVVGPETPLAAGIIDELASAGIKAFGPSN